MSRGPRLFKIALDKAAKAKRSTIIVTNLDGQPWKGFGSYFGNGWGTRIRT